MDDFIWGLLCFGVSLVAVAFVGHGLWVLATNLCKTLVGEPVPRNVPRRDVCEACGAQGANEKEYCQSCGYLPNLTPRARDKAELATLMRVLRRWEAEGRIHAEQIAELEQIAKGCAAPELVFDDVIDAVPVYETFTPAQTFASAPWRREAPSASNDGIYFDAPQATVDHAPLQPAVVVSPPIAPFAPSAPVEIHPLDRDYPAEVEASAGPTFSARAKRRVADVLQAFMEERNIRWGEVIAGLLIVGSAIGCVVSLQETLRAADPYVLAFLFLLATAAIHGAGLYTLRRWSLHSVSRAVLIIVLLLVPLNFLVATSSPERRAVTDPIYLLAVGVGVAAFGLLCWSASRSLVREAAPLLTAAVLGPAVSQLFLSRMLSAGANGFTVRLLFALPVACFLAALIAQTWRATRWKAMTHRRAEQSWIIAGVAAFSLSAAGGLVLHRLESVTRGMELLSPLVAIVGSSVVAWGLAMARPATLQRFATIRTASLAVALLGGSLLVANLTFAWPDPALMIVVALISFAALATMAIGFGQPALHGSAIVCLTLAYMVGFHLYHHGGYDPELGRQLGAMFWMGRSSVALSVLALAVAAAGWGLRRAGRRGDGLYYFGACGALAALSVLIALGVGFFHGPDANWATPILAVYAFALLAVCMIRPVPVVASVGSLLLLAAIVHGLVINPDIRITLESWSLSVERPLVAACWLYALANVVLAAVLWRSSRQAFPALPLLSDLAPAFQPEAVLRSLHQGREENSALTITVWNVLALAASAVALPFALTVTGDSTLPNAIYLATAAVVCFGVAWIHGQPVVFAAFGWIITAALVYGVTAFAQQQPWWSRSFDHPRYLQLLAGAIAVWSTIWTVVRAVARRWPRLDSLLRTPWPAAHEIALGAAVFVLGAIAVVACTPGIAAELGLTGQDYVLANDAWRLTMSDSRAWMALGLVAIALAAIVVRRASLAAYLGMTFTLATAVLLAAAPFEASLATASAVRWGFALYGAVMAVVLCARTPLRRWLDRFPVSRGGIDHREVEVLRAMTFAMTLLPILGLTFLAANRMLTGHSLGGPAAGAWFGSLAPSVLYGAPLLALVGILTAYAVRESKEQYLMAASVLFQLTATLACLLAIAPLGDDARIRVALLQWNAVALGAFALVWRQLRNRIQPDGARSPAMIGLYELQCALAVLTVVALAAWGAAAVFVDPANPARDVTFLGREASYLALALAFVASWQAGRSHRSPARSELCVGAIWTLGALAAASIVSYSSPQSWTSYYVLTAVSLIVAAANAFWAWATARNEVATEREDGEGAKTSQVARFAFLPTSRAATRWALAAGLVTCVFALGAAKFDPWRPWWSAGPIAVLAACAGVLSIARDRRGYGYLGMALTLTATSCVAMGPFIGLWQRSNPEATAEFLQSNVLALALAGSVSLAWVLRRRDQELKGRVYFAPSVHAFAAVMGVLGFTLLALLGLGIGALDREFWGSSGPLVGTWFGLGVAVALAAFLGASLWDAQTRYPLPCLYLWAAACAVLVIDRLKLDLEHTLLALTLAAGTHIMLTSLLWRGGIGIAKSAARLKIPEPVEGLKRVSRWLPAVNATAAIPLTPMAMFMVLGFEDRGMRFGAALVPLLLAIGVAALAQQHRRAMMQILALSLATFAAVFLGWADIEPGVSTAVWLNRAVRLLIVLAAIAAVLAGVGLRWLSPEHNWRNSVRRMTFVNGVAALSALGLVLILEWGSFRPVVGVPGIEGPQIFAVAVALVGLIAALISLALFPKHDPLSLTEDWRMAYVYTAEVIAGLLFAHLYMTLPELFSGVLRDYWAYIVVLIAYVGVGLGEVFRRSGIRVLAEPLGRTGVFLPLLPGIAFWEQASLTGYAGVLFWIGLLYVLLSYHHGSFKYGVAAAVAGNMALWALMKDRQFSFLEHPQFWIIPPALSVLTASHLTRRQLSETQLTAIRYVAMLAIYLSSTGEMFIEGIGRSLWPVMVLMTLSVAGVLAGIGLRVRAFLYLGAGFIVLSLVSMVWHAARALEHVWPWWAFGFALGIAILALFAVFEKRRDSFLIQIEHLKSWEM